MTTSHIEVTDQQARALLFAIIREQDLLRQRSREVDPDSALIDLLAQDCQALQDIAYQLDRIISPPIASRKARRA